MRSTYLSWCRYHNMGPWPWLIFINVVWAGLFAYLLLRPEVQWASYNKNTKQLNIDASLVNITMSQPTRSLGRPKSPDPLRLGSADEHLGSGLFVHGDLVVNDQTRIHGDLHVHGKSNHNACNVKSGCTCTEISYETVKCTGDSVICASYSNSHGRIDL